MAEQYVFDWYLDTQQLSTFLSRWCALEDDEDRIREEKRALKEEYKDEFPMRATLAAIKVVRTRRKLAEHRKEPMPYKDQDYLQTLVEEHLAQHHEARAERDRLLAR